MVGLIAVVLLICTSGAVGDSCKGTLKFQTAPASNYFDENWTVLGLVQRSSASSPIHFYSNLTAFNAVDCANLCYDDVIYFCNSAVFEPWPSSHAGSARGGNCKLSQRALPCLSTDQRERRKRQSWNQRKAVHQVSDSSKGRVLLFCFRCVENEDGLETGEKVPLATVPPPTEIEKHNENVEVPLVPVVNSKNTENVPVEGGVQEEREFDSLLHPSMFVQGSKMKLVPLRIMTFNTWIGGANVNNGVHKIANHVSSTGTDIVALQETSGAIVDQVVRALGGSWKRCSTSNGDSDYILTRHPIVENYEPSTKLWNTGCRIQINEYPNKFVNMWGVHLDWRDYGPYTACFEKPKRPTDIYPKLYYNEHKHKGEQNHLGRMNNIVSLMNHAPFSKNMQDSDSIPLFVAGDFNTPSHLDWTEQMRLLHCNTSYEWPVSKLLHDSAFKDSYRQVYPNPGVSTGFTWTPLHKMSPDDPSGQRPEPQDRIDFIYYRGKFVRARRSSVYKGFDEMKLYPSHRDNDWPSDHAAVMSDFEILVTT